MHVREDIPFELIPLNEVPCHDPVIKPPGHLKGSQWDRAIDALLQACGAKALKVTESDPRKRKSLKATLLTRAKNRKVPLQVLESYVGIYACISTGRAKFAFPSPVPFT